MEFDLLTLPRAINGRAKNDTTLADSCPVLIITTEFGEFLPNRFRRKHEGQTDGSTVRQTETLKDRQPESITISPHLFFYSMEIMSYTG